MAIMVLFLYWKQPSKKFNLYKSLTWLRKSKIDVKQNKLPNLLDCLHTDRTQRNAKELKNKKEPKRTIKK